MMAEQVEMDNGYITSVTDIETTVLHQSSNGEYCYTVDVDDRSEPHGKMRLWCSDDLDKYIIERIRDNSHIRFSAERDEDGDMVITKLQVLH